MTVTPDERLQPSPSKAEVLQIVNLSEMPPGWSWLEGAVGGDAVQRWTAVTTRGMSVPAPLPATDSSRRWFAARAASRSMQPPNAVLVSHGPHMTLYGSAALASCLRQRRHLAYAFNFTQLPRGLRRSAMKVAFRSVDRFVCFSTMERRLYADHFDIDIDRIDMIHWAVRPPEVDAAKPALVPGDYVCAIGSQGRDYATLLQAMARLPARKLVLVATPESIEGLSIPANVDVRCRLPFDEAMNILAHSRLHIVPLAGSQVPCGHVTIVAAMHLAKATLVTDSSGVADYVEDGVTGLTVVPGDPVALAQGIERALADEALMARLGRSAKAFASTHCVEAVVIRYFEDYLQRGRHA